MMKIDQATLLRLYLTLLLAFIYTAQSVAQEDTCSAGIYKTKSDLVENRITHKVPGNTKGYKFDFLFPADLKLTIKIVTPESTQEFKPGSVFGYNKCGRRHRYYNGGDLLAQEDYYRIEEMGPLVIYSSVFVSGDEKFYSQGIDAPIRRLQMNNIEEDFGKYPAFVEAVKDLGKTGLRGDITKQENGKYEINRIYQEKVGSEKKSGYLKKIK